MDRFLNALKFYHLVSFSQNKHTYCPQAPAIFKGLYIRDLAVQVCAFLRLNTMVAWYF